jgi:hypothetical protein
MPWMIVSLVSSSELTRKVGSSFVKRRSAFDMFVWLLLSFGSIDERDDRVGDEHRRHRVVELAVGERVARVAVDAEQGDDVARVGDLDVLHLVGVHAHEAADLVASCRSESVVMKSPLASWPW